MLKNFQQLCDMLTTSERIPKLGVVVAQDRHTLEAVATASKEKLITPVLYGHRASIQSIWESVAPNQPLPDIKENDDTDVCISAAMADVHTGELDCIMKGGLETGVLMKAVVNREHGIKQSAALSLIGLIESPYYHKVFAISDVGLMTYPTLEQKKAIIENAVDLFHLLGESVPKVAVLAAVEKVNPKMPESVDAYTLKEMNQSAAITGCIVEGPISYDLCMDKEAATIKGYQSEVAGDPDILIVPDIVSGNLLAKSLICTGGAKTCGTVLGAKVPIVLTSRSATAEDKYMSIVLASVIGSRMHVN